MLLQPCRKKTSLPWVAIGMSYKMTANQVTAKAQFCSSEVFHGIVES